VLLIAEAPVFAKIGAGVLAVPRRLTISSPMTVALFLSWVGVKADIFVNRLLIGVSAPEADDNIFKKSRTSGLLATDSKFSILESATVLEIACWHGTKL
jgi:hypothetical protein